MVCACPGFEPTTSGFKAQCANRTAILPIVESKVYISLPGIVVGLEFVFMPELRAVDRS